MNVATSARAMRPGTRSPESATLNAPLGSPSTSDVARTITHSHELLLELLVRELLLQEERDEQLLLEEAEHRARLEPAPAVADAHRRQGHEASRARALHRLQDVPRRDRHDVRGRLAVTGAAARSDRAKHGLLTVE